MPITTTNESGYLPQNMKLFRVYKSEQLKAIKWKWKKNKCFKSFTTNGNDKGSHSPDGIENMG
jgi:hypothetical protein